MIECNKSKIKHKKEKVENTGYCSGNKGNKKEGDGEGNGTPLQYSCLENPKDRGAWWASVSGVAQSWTRLKRLSSSSSKKEGEGGHQAHEGRRRKTWKTRVDSGRRGRHWSDRRWKGGNEEQAARVNYFFKMCGKEDKRWRRVPWRREYFKREDYLCLQAEGGNTRTKKYIYIQIYIYTLEMRSARVIHKAHY